MVLNVTMRIRRRVALLLLCKIASWKVACMIRYLMDADTLRVMELFGEPESVKRRLWS